MTEFSLEDSEFERGGDEENTERQMFTLYRGKEATRITYQGGLGRGEQDSHFSFFSVRGPFGKYAEKLDKKRK